MSIELQEARPEGMQCFKCGKPANAVCSEKKRLVCCTLFEGCGKSMCAEHTFAQKTWFTKCETCCYDAEEGCQGRMMTAWKQ